MARVRSTVVERSNNVRQLSASAPPAAAATVSDGAQRLVVGFHGAR